MRNRRTNVIGNLVGQFEPLSAEILRGVSQAVGGTWDELLAYYGGGGGSTVVGWRRRYLSRPGGTLIDDAILAPTVVDPRAPIPVVAIDAHAGKISAVDSDNLTGAIQATQHLLLLGTGGSASSADVPT